MAVGILTGASRGLGLALVPGLVERGWRLCRRAGSGCARGRGRRSRGRPRDPGRRRRPWAPPRARRGGRRPHRSARQQRGPSRADPQPALAAYPLSELARVYEFNVFAPLALVQEALPRLAPGAAILHISSDAAVEPYEGWGGYGSSKAALVQLTAILAAEQSRLRVYSVDPGDMRTQTYQEAFPGEDISHVPLAEESVPGLLRADRGLACEWPLPGARARAGLQRERARASRSAGRARAAGSAWGRPRRRRDARCEAAPGSFVHARFHQAAAVPVRGRPARRQHLCDAAGRARRPPRRATRLQLWLSSPAPDGTWLVELRTSDRASLPAAARGCSAWTSPAAPLPSCLHVSLAANDSPSHDSSSTSRFPGLPAPTRPADSLRLCPRAVAARRLPNRLRPGARQRGDAGAGRPFTAELVAELVARGVLLSPVTLHTGVSSPERGEPPFPERFQVPPATARLVNAVHGWNGHVIAVGTTVVRALETMAVANSTVFEDRAGQALRRHARARATRDRRPAHRLARERILARRPARGRGRWRLPRALLPGRARAWLPVARVRRPAPDPAVTRLVGINHVALEVGDVEEALAFYGRFFEFTLRARSRGAAFIDIGDQFIALMEGRSGPPDRARHFGLVVDDKEATRRALESAGVQIRPGGGLRLPRPLGQLRPGRAVRRGAVQEGRSRAAGHQDRPRQERTGPRRAAIQGTRVAVPAITPHIVVRGAAEAAAWYTRALAAEG